MDQGEGIDPIEYLDRFFEEIRQEARDNPDFAHRLVKSLGGEVVFHESLKSDVLNPLIVAATETEAGLRASFSNLTKAKLKRVLKTHNLATTLDLRGLEGPQLLDMLVVRARAKALERTSRPSQSLGGRTTGDAKR